jgi:hypothetical protein
LVAQLQELKEAKPVATPEPNQDIAALAAQLAQLQQQLSSVAAPKKRGRPSKAAATGEAA